MRTDARQVPRLVSSVRCDLVVGGCSRCVVGAVVGVADRLAAFNAHLATDCEMVLGRGIDAGDGDSGEDESDIFAPRRVTPSVRI